MVRLLIRALVVVFVLAGAVMPAAATSRSSLPEIVIPAIHVDAPVVSLPLTQGQDGSVTWDTSKLRWTVGHLGGTSWFGEAGKVVLGGHSETARRKPDVFYYLNRVWPGDEIIVYLGEQELRYQVVEQRIVEATDVSVLYPTGGEQLTLITCDRSSYRRDGTYSRRVVVTAVRVQ